MEVHTANRYARWVGRIRSGGLLRAGTGIDHEGREEVGQEQREAAKEIREVAKERREIIKEARDVRSDRRDRWHKPVTVILAGMALGTSVVTAILNLQSVNAAREVAELNSAVAIRSGAIPQLHGLELTQDAAGTDIFSFWISNAGRAPTDIFGGQVEAPDPAPSNCLSKSFDWDASTVVPGNPQGWLIESGVSKRFSVPLSRTGSTCVPWGNPHSRLVSVNLLYGNGCHFQGVASVGLANGPWQGTWYKAASDGSPTETPAELDCSSTELHVNFQGEQSGS